MRQQRTEPAAIEAEIAHLRSLALDALRRRWRVVFGRTPPAGLSKDLLGRMIAWRLQEQAFGGLDRESLSFLEGLARHGGFAPPSAQTRHFFALQPNGTKNVRGGRNGSHPASRLNNASVPLQTASQA
jgi:hypothetical protein